MQFKRITIIMPNYNYGHYLEQAIISVLDQAYPNLEFIIIDGGSTDNSKEIIKKYEKHLAYWVSEKDKGTYDAINKALKIFTGDYWCVINSDDTLLPGALHETARFVQQNSFPDWVTGGIQFIDEQSNIIGRSVPVFPHKVGGSYFLNECWIYHPVTFLSRKLYEAVGDFSRMDIMDYDYWIRAEMSGFTPVILTSELGCLRYHDESKSMGFLKIYQAKVDLLTGYLHQLKEEQLVKELQRHISQLQLSLLQTKIKLLLFQKRYIKTTGLLLQTLLKYPVQIFKKWPYGLMRRFFSGIEEGEFSPKYFLKNMK